MKDHNRHRLTLITDRYAARQADKQASNRRVFEASFRDVVARVIRPQMEDVVAALREAGHAPSIAVDAAHETPSIELCLGISGVPDKPGVNLIGFAVIERRGRPEVLVYLVVSRPPPMDLVRFEAPEEITSEFVEQTLIDSVEHIFSCHSI